jgi:putative hemolysin
VIPASALPLLFTLPALMAASAVCSASETALFSLTHSDRLRLRKANPGAARAVATLLAQPRRLLVLLLLCNTTVNVAYFVLSRIMAERFESPGAALVVGVGAVLLLILFGEVVPKSLAAVYRVRAAALIARTILLAGRVLGPLCALVDALAVRPLSLIARPAGAGAAASITVDELSALLEAGADRGVIEESEQRLLSDVVELGTLHVRDIMTPRVDIHWLDQRASPERLIDLIRTTGHTKFPVCRGSLDGGVIGLVNGKHYLAARAAGALGERTGPGQNTVPIPYVPERARLDKLLDLFGDRGTHVALCVDEAGAVTGLVEVEDVVRQLVRTGAEVPGSDTEGVTQTAPGVWSVPGRLSIHEWAEFFGEAVTGARLGPSWGSRRVSTVGGLIFSRLGRVPRAGDGVRIGNVALRVEAMNGRVIERVSVSVADGSPHRPPGASP